ncbi:hypothetical protein G9A89_010622 [Geosiphon pyriformis]|nr:hypothetical protein G9A89_010622 [Geosiphon pyriformis]
MHPSSENNDHVARTRTRPIHHPYSLQLRSACQSQKPQESKRRQKKFYKKQLRKPQPLHTYLDSYNSSSKIPFDDVTFKDSKPTDDPLNQEHQVELSNQNSIVSKPGKLIRQVSTAIGIPALIEAFSTENSGSTPNIKEACSSLNNKPNEIEDDWDFCGARDEDQDGEEFFMGCSSKFTPQLQDTKTTLKPGKKS